MADGGSIDERLAPHDFVTDFVWAARAVRDQPSVAFVSIALWVLPTVLFQRDSHGKPFSAGFFVSLLITIFYLGWCGAERVFFLRRREGRAVTLSELLNSTHYWGRFLRLGLLMMVALFPAFFIVGYVAAHAFHFGVRNHLQSHAVTLMGMAVVVPIDFALTFVPSALVFTTRSARQAIRIGVGMIRRTWPRSGLYVLCPPLALNMVNAIYRTDIPIVHVVTAAGLALLALVTKGAIAAFYLREHPVSPELIAQTP